MVALTQISDDFDDLRDILPTEQPPPLPPLKIQQSEISVRPDEVDLDVEINEEEVIEQAI